MSQTKDSTLGNTFHFSVFFINLFLDVNLVQVFIFKKTDFTTFSLEIFPVQCYFVKGRM
jgi:hypothetical protein